MLQEWDLPVVTAVPARPNHNTHTKQSHM